VAAHHFRGGPIRDAEPHGDRLGLAVGADDPYATGRGAAAALAPGEFVVLRLLLCRQDLPDARAHSFAYPLRLRLALLLGKPRALTSLSVCLGGWIRFPLVVRRPGGAPPGAALASAGRRPDRRPGPRHRHLALHHGWPAPRRRLRPEGGTVVRHC